MKDLAFQRPFLQNIEMNSPQAKNYIGMRKLFDDYLLKLNVPFYDSCCPSVTGNNFPLRYNIDDDVFQRYDPTIPGWVVVTPDSGSLAFISLTKSAADALITANGLHPGSFYKITDRGDRGILLQALSNNLFTREGIRYMLVPTDYNSFATVGTKESIGVWNADKTIDTGSGMTNTAIWGGNVWRNTSGDIGSNFDAVTLDPGNWQLISKASFTDSEYTIKPFGISYDYENDWIERQWDGAGNVFGITFNDETNVYMFGYNLCDVSDWNASTVLGLSFFGNTCLGVYNNVTSNIYLNHNDGVIRGNGCPIYENSNDGDITDNGSNIIGIFGNTNRGHITNNNFPNASLAISFNDNAGAIISNLCDGEILGNTNRGDIASNTNGGVISYNSNGGEISQNSNTGAIGNNACMDEIHANTDPVTNIVANTNQGNISTNTNSGTINQNSNGGDIVGNSIGGNISLNRNGGAIEGNANTGDILNNFNSQFINGNTSNCNHIKDNGNNGDITSNDGASLDILKNSNNGRILSNTNAVVIELNSNCGDISNNVTPCSQIRANTNNGSIIGNSNNGQIEHNSNSGDIGGNSVDGAISFNANTAINDLDGRGIYSNSAPCRSIISNNNTGAINGNNNDGDDGISYNSNGGRITENHNLGSIAHNKNNGAIIGCSSSPDSCDIINNINNGDISGVFSADVTDPVVNK